MSVGNLSSSKWRGAIGFLVLGIGVWAGWMAWQEWSGDDPQSRADATSQALSDATGLGRIVGEHCLEVLVADTQSERSQGVRSRVSLAPYDAMIFENENDTTAAFTMSGVTFPLTIGFYDAQGVQVDSADMTPCAASGGDCPTYPPSRPYRSALEVAQGSLPQGNLGGSCDP